MGFLEPRSLAPPDPVAAHPVVLRTGGLRLADVTTGGVGWRVGVQFPRGSLESDGCWVFITFALTRAAFMVSLDCLLLMFVFFRSVLKVPENPPISACEWEGLPARSSEHQVRTGA